MKKALLIAITLTMMIGLVGVQSIYAADDGVVVYFTVSNGSLLNAQIPVNVSDSDGDGALTIYDAMYCAHEQYYEGGAASGFVTATGDYGLYIVKLWGIENGVSFGYYLNNTSAMGLTDAVKNGDYLNAFVYTDTTGVSDTYCYFDVNVKSVEAGAEFTLTLSAAGYDANWNPVTLPVEGAVITVDGEKTSYTTDAEGKAVITLDKTGDVIISALSDAQILVPPVCRVNVTSSEAPDTGDSGIYVLGAACALVILSGVAISRKKSYEK